MPITCPTPKAVILIRMIVQARKQDDEWVIAIKLVSLGAALAQMAMLTLNACTTLKSLHFVYFLNDRYWPLAACQISVFSQIEWPLSRQRLGKSETLVDFHNYRIRQKRIVEGHRFAGRLTGNWKQARGQRLLVLGRQRGHVTYD